MRVLCRQEALRIVDITSRLQDRQDLRCPELRANMSKPKGIRSSCFSFFRGLAQSWLFVLFQSSGVGCSNRPTFLLGFETRGAGPTFVICKMASFSDESHNIFLTKFVQVSNHLIILYQFISSPWSNSDGFISFCGSFTHPQLIQLSLAQT